MHVVIVAGLAGMIYRRLLVVTELFVTILDEGSQRIVKCTVQSLYTLPIGSGKKHADVVECKAVMESK